MEERTIMVANTKTQKRSTITTNAETLGQLKAALAENGIDYSGMTFTEGISKTTLNNDDSILPSSLMYKGQRTNNLIILLTNTKKNIASGMGDRSEAYDIIRSNNKQDEVKEEFGRNFTQVPTKDLWNFINEVIFDEDEDVEDDDDDLFCDDEDDEEEECSCSAPAEDIVGTVYDYIKQSAKMGTMTTQQVADLAELIDDLAAILKEGEAIKVGNIEVSENELDDMIASLA